MNNHRRKNFQPRLNQLENRELLTGIATQPDYFNMLLPGNAQEFPVATVDVLANDNTPNLRILAFNQPQLGTVEKIAATGANGREILKYTPGPNFRGYDFFQYTAVNETGLEGTDTVYIKFDHIPDTFNPWLIQAPESITVTPGVTTQLLDDSGKPLFAVNYQGQEKANAGVLLRFNPYLNFSAFGTLETDVTRTDAQFYPQLNGYVWIYGSIDGVNALLSGLKYTPTASITSTPGVSIGLHGFIYSELGVTVESLSKSTNIIATGSSSVPAQGQDSPVAVNDDYSFDSLTDSIALDVLSNDSARTISGRLELIDVQTTGNPKGLAWIDQSTNQLIYQPPAGFIGTDEYIYTVRNDNGLVAQALVKITATPDLTFVGTSGGDRGTMIEIYNSQSGQLMREFKPFERYSGGMMLESADMNADGVSEIFAMQAGGENRMRIFDALGNTMVDTVYLPFASRRVSGMDMEIGNIDRDLNPEMLFVASSSRGYEISVVDSATMQPQLSNVMRGMAGVPQLEFNDDTNQLMIMGRTRGGGLVMASMSPAPSGNPRISRRSLVSDRDMRQLTRRNGPVTDVTLAATDFDSDGELDDRMVQILFNNGLVQQMMLADNGSVRSMRINQPSDNQPQVIMSALGLAMTPSGDMVWDESTDPSRRNRSRIVAVG